MEFETVLKIIIVMAATVGIPIAAYAAVAATRAIWGRPTGAGDRRLQEEVESLRARVEDLERAQTRMAELEERVDFAERLLARAPAEMQRMAPGGDRS